MDIREWLQNTADRNPPEEQEYASLSGPSRPQRRASKPIHSRQRKRVSDGPRSVGAHRESPEERSRQTSHSSSPDHRRAVEGDAADSSSDDSSQDTDSSVSARAQEPIRSYERRARHKTRPDRYEAKTKSVKQDRRSRSKTKRKRRRHHRDADGARTTGLVQSFQLKNGPKKNRLTLRPEASVGIFSNGRASSSMAANGPGLPDLVFNEMKFLTRSKDAQANEVSSRSKKSRKELREEEISSYFRNVTAEKRTEQDQQPDASHADNSTFQPAVEHDSIMRQSAGPQHPAKPPEKATSGTGSRGEIRGDSASGPCYTWSESVAPVQKAPPRQSQSVPLTQTSPGQLPARKCSQRSQTSSKSLQHHQRHILKDSLGPEKKNEAGLPRHYGAGKASRKRRHSGTLVPHLESALGSTTSIHLDRPKATSHATVSANGRGSDGHHTSDILVLHETREYRFRSPSLPHRRSASQPSADQENIDPITSTPASTLLRDALDAVTKPLQTFDSSPKRDSPGMMAATVEQTRSNATEAERLLSASQYVDMYGRPLLAESSRMQVPRRGLIRAGQNDKSGMELSLRRDSAATSNTRGWSVPTQLAPFSQRYEQSMDANATTDSVTWPTMREWPSNTSGHAEEYVHQLAEHEMPDFYTPSAMLQDVGSGEAYLMRPQEELERDMHWTEPDQMRPHDGLEHGEEVEHPDVEPFVDGDASHDAMIGFWRPNILY